MNRKDLHRKIKYNIVNTVKKMSTLIIILSMSACSKDFVEVDVDKAQITKDLVFSGDLTATAAIAGIYNYMYNSNTSFANGANNSLTTLSSLSADETNFFPNNLTWKEFEQNKLSPQNSQVLNLWKSMYHTIYEANSALEGLENAKRIGTSVRKQLKGECLFVRAFAHFYLVNLFGDVPLVTTTDYRINSKIERSEAEKVYEQIVADLTEAQLLIDDAYFTDDRVRPNKGAATALLARVFLYARQYGNAEEAATQVINDTKYKLESDLNRVFLKNSQEAIWQLMPQGTGRNTNEGYMLILTGTPSSINNPVALAADLINAFETGDTRSTQWIDSITSSATYYFPFKYKVKNGGTSSNPAVPFNEYSMVLRLAEQYLIRAEARAQQSDLSGAIADLDAIRSRALLPLIANTNPGIGKNDLLLAIEHERQVELFAEWGHRWLDLKRTGRADAVLIGKPGWISTAQLYPIPQSELDKNPFLGKQNDGY